MDLKHKEYNVCLIGTSNAIIKSGYASEFSASNRINIFKNISIGASTSSFIFFYEGKINFSDYDFCIIDLCVNDYRWMQVGQVNPETWYNAVLDFTANVINSGCIPILLILPSPEPQPSDTFLKIDAAIRGMTIELANFLKIPYFDCYEVLESILAISKAPLNIKSFFRDSVHIHDWLGSEFSKLIINSLDDIKQKFGDCDPFFIQSYQHKYIAIEGDYPQFKRGSSLLKLDFKLLKNPDKRLSIVNFSNFYIISYCADLIASFGRVGLSTSNSSVILDLTNIYSKESWEEKNNAVIGFRPLISPLKLTSEIVSLDFDDAQDVRNKFKKSQIMIHGFVARSEHKSVREVRRKFNGNNNIADNVDLSMLKKLLKLAQRFGVNTSDTRNMDDITQSTQHLKVLSEKRVFINKWGLNWVCRRANHCLNFSVIDFSNDQLLAVMRNAGTTDLEEIRLASNKFFLEESGYFEFEIKAICSNFFQNGSFDFEVLVFDENSDELTKDPYVFDLKPEKIIKYTVKFADDWVRVVINASEDFVSKKILIRFNFANFQHQQSQGSDTILIQNFKIHTNSTVSVLDRIGTHKSVDFISPYMRFVGNSTSSNLLVTFSSLDFPKNKYQLLSFFSGLGGNRLLINEEHQNWYLDGISEITESIDESVQLIKQLIILRGILQTSSFGFSKGGYGAILYGILLNFDRILAFNAEIPLFQDGSRSKDRIENVDRVRNTQYYDLRNLIPNFDGKLLLYYSEYDQVDKLTFENLDEIASSDKFVCRTMPLSHNVGEYLLSNYNWVVLFLKYGHW